MAPKASGTSPARTSSTIAMRAYRTRLGGDQVGEVPQQLAGQVVDDDVAEVLEQLRGGRLAAAGQAGEDHDLLVVRLVRGGVAPGRRSGRVDDAGSGSPLAHRRAHATSPRLTCRCAG